MCGVHLGVDDALDQGEELLNSSTWAHKVIRARGCFCAWWEEVPSAHPACTRAALPDPSAVLLCSVYRAGLDWAGPWATHTRAYEAVPGAGPEDRSYRISDCSILLSFLSGCRLSSLLFWYCSLKRGLLLLHPLRAWKSSSFNQIRFLLFLSKSTFKRPVQHRINFFW